MKMKSIGIVRKVDHLGRIVLPKEIRKALGVADGTPMGVFVDGDSIRFKIHDTACAFCGETENLIVFNERKICMDCAEKIKLEMDERNRADS